jgi:hypothetical protein
MGPKAAVEFRQTGDQPRINRGGESRMLRLARRDSFEVDERVNLVAGPKGRQDLFEGEAQLAARSS